MKYRTTAWTIESTPNIEPPDVRWWQRFREITEEKRRADAEVFRLRGRLNQAARERELLFAEASPIGSVGDFGRTKADIFAAYRVAETLLAYRHIRQQHISWSEAEERATEGFSSEHDNGLDAVGTTAELLHWLFLRYDYLGHLQYNSRQPGDEDYAKLLRSVIRYLRAELLAGPTVDLDGVKIRCRA